MNLYQYLNENQTLTTVVKLIRNGVIIDGTILNHLSIYDRFYQLEGTKGERYQNLSKEFRMHPDTIRKIITKLNQPAR